MKKRIIPKILFAATIILSLGIGVAYYNTSTLGYDNANIISFDEEKVNIFIEPLQMHIHFLPL